MSPGAARQFTAAACVTLAALPLAAQQASPTYRASTRTVVLHATVRAPDGRLATQLPREAFTVHDNGRAVPVTVFSNDPQPLTAVLLIDTSGSMEANFLRIREAMGQFVDTLRPEDRLRIGSFGEEVALSPHLTSDKKILRRVLSEELWPGGATPMWNATLAAMRSLAGEAGRRVVVILTDGANMTDDFKGSAADVRRGATAEGVMIYAIGVEKMGLHKDLKRIVDDTGGGWYELAGGDDLSSTFTRVLDELRHQYLLGFTPAALDGREHRLEVRLTDATLKARARRSYIAAREIPVKR
jgi:VWFA-related protein